MNTPWLWRLYAVGSTAADFEGLTRLIRDANHQGYVALEYEAKEGRFTAVPRHPDKRAALLR